MNTETTKTETNSSPAPTLDSSKLVSLLALAAGAVAMPQTSNADIIFTDLGTNPVTLGPNNIAPFTITNLPGVARLGFVFRTRMTVVTSSRYVLAGQVAPAAAYVWLKTNASFIVQASQGKTWNQIPGRSSTFGAVGAANGQGIIFPSSYSHQYLGFKFKDSTHAGAFRYGWIDVSLDNPPSANGPDVTIFGYAYDNTGTRLGMGLVPEPSSMSLFALGALALGAKALRAWRRNRPSPSSFLGRSLFAR